MAYRIHNSSLLLSIALASAMLFYILTSHRGIQHYTAQAEQVVALRQQVAAQEAEVKKLQTQVQAWETENLERERFFRYELGMGYTNEVVYLLPDATPSEQCVS